MYQLYCRCLLRFQLCSRYLYEVNSCYSITGLCYSDIRSVSGTGATGTGSQLWKLPLHSRLTGTQQEKLIHVLSQFQKVSIPRFFPFHFQRHIKNLYGKNCRKTKTVKSSEGLNFNVEYTVHFTSVPSLLFIMSLYIQRSLAVSFHNELNTDNHFLQV